MKLWLIIFIFLSGCGLISEPHPSTHDISLSNQGYNPLHATSCGPHAIGDLLKEYGDYHKRKDISKDILSNRSEIDGLICGIMSLFDWEAGEITFPGEIEKYLCRHGYDVAVISGNDKELKTILQILEQNDVVGIAFLKDSTSIQSHYKVFPPIDEVETYYEKTEIRLIYLVSKKN